MTFYSDALYNLLYTIIFGTGGYLTHSYQRSLRCKQCLMTDSFLLFAFKTSVAGAGPRFPRRTPGVLFRVNECRQLHSETVLIVLHVYIYRFRIGKHLVNFGRPEIVLCGLEKQYRSRPPLVFVSGIGYRRPCPVRAIMTFGLRMCQQLFNYRPLSSSGYLYRCQVLVGEHLHCLA